jgi:predicted MFS family arabinose efflux permease
VSSQAITTKPNAEPVEALRISRRYALYALGIIFFANFLSYLDRQVVSGLERELEGAFGLTKAQFGWLWTAFTVGYMVFAPIVGFLTAKQHRPRIFGVCVFVWSLATIWSGLAGKIFGEPLVELYTARFLIGIGEAGCLVIGPTLIADYFSKQVRGKALATFFLGMPLGGFAGYATAALVVRQTGDWRDAFFVAGVPGIALAVLVWLLIDPPRGGEVADAHGHGAVKFEGIAPYWQLFKNRTLMLIILAQAFAVMILVPLLHFGVRFMEAKFNMTKTEATMTIGGISLAAGILGNCLSGVIGDQLAKRIKGAYALLAGIAYIIGAPLLIVGFITSSKEIMLLTLTGGAFCFFLCMPAVNTQIANSVPARLRAMAFALAVFILHLLGDTFAPVAFGKVDDLIGERIKPLPAAVAGRIGLLSPPTSAGPLLALSSYVTRQDSAILGRQWAFVLFSCSLFAAGACSLLAVRTARRDEAAAEAPREDTEAAMARAGPVTENGLSETPTAAARRETQA